MNSDKKLSICLFSEPNFLSVNILENLLSKNCVVNVVTSHMDHWKARTVNLSDKSRFSIISKKEIHEPLVSDYSIFCCGFLNKHNALKEYQEFSSKGDFSGSKNLVIFPFEIFNRKKFSIGNIGDNTAVIYIGDLIGPRIDMDSDLSLPNFLSEMIFKKQLTLGIGEIFYPVFVADTSNLILKWLFSFGPYGKETFVLGTQVSGSDFWKINQKLLGELKIKYDKTLEVRTVPKGYDVENLSCNLQFVLSETYGWLRNNTVGSKNQRLVIEKPDVKIESPANPLFANPLSLFFSEKHNVEIKSVSHSTPDLHSSSFSKTNKKKTSTLSRKLRPFLILLFLILIFPFITISIFFGFSYISYKQFLLGKTSSAGSMVLVAKTFAVISDKESLGLTYIPVIGRVYSELSFVAQVGEKVSDVFLNLIPASRDSINIAQGILGHDGYDITGDSSAIASSLSVFYQQISNIEQETFNASSQNIYLADIVSQKVDFEKIKNDTRQVIVLFSNLPKILGVGQSKTYLVLFQNNMELRPTGGFIGSYGLLTFDDGRLSDMVVSDVYSADGQLNGHVEPPAPIKKYLNEANWWLRDSNWDPDFPTSAKRAEWFLDKEISKEVDGVVAIDLSPVKDILKYTGPIFLSDFNMNITSDNLYTNTQAEAQDNFFPGSRAKASFLTALSRNLISDIGKLNTQQKIGVLKSLYLALVQRHFQIFLHDDASQAAIAALGWNGSVSYPDCGQGCYPDLIGVVEANLGDNKANYFIQRQTSLQVDLKPGEIDRKLILTLKDSANQALGPSGVYKVYIRLLIPADSELTRISAINGQNQVNLSPEISVTEGRQEVGVWVQVLNGDTRSFIFDWKNIISPGSYSSYGLYVRKQAGIDSDPLSVLVNTEGLSASTDSRFTLTRSGGYSYNTNLIQDLFAKLWINKY